MTDTVTIYLPLNTYVSVYGFTNAGYQQRSTLTEESGAQHVMTGSGEHNNPMDGGNWYIQTPPTSQNPEEGYRVTVKMEHDGGSGWQPSNAISGRVSVMYFNQIIVVSEDWIDEDYNDCVVEFAWWSPPATR